MTNDGFSGNARYLIMPAAVACVLAGTGIGWLIRALPARVVGGGFAVAALSVVAARGLRGPERRSASTPSAASVYYQARLTDGLAGAIAQAGGPDRLKACGTAYTGAFQVPSVAWLLGEHTTTVRSASAPGRRAAAGARPSSCARATTSGSHPVPGIESLGGEAGVQTFAISGGWRIVGNCG